MPPAKFGELNIERFDYNRLRHLFNSNTVVTKSDLQQNKNVDTIRKALIEGRDENFHRLNQIAKQRCQLVEIKRAQGETSKKGLSRDPTPKKTDVMLPILTTRLDKTLHATHNLNSHSILMQKEKTRGPGRKESFKRRTSKLVNVFSAERAGVKQSLKKQEVSEAQQLRRHLELVAMAGPL